MKRALWLGMVWAAGLLGLAGCIPVNVPQTPAARGFVVDAGTGAPIAGARVSFRGVDGSAAVTGADGWFNLQPRMGRRWLPPLPFDFMGVPGVMVVEARGYARLVFDQKVDRWPAWSTQGRGGYRWTLEALPEPPPGATQSEPAGQPSSTDIVQPSPHATPAPSGAADR